MEEPPEPCKWVLEWASGVFLGGALRRRIGVDYQEGKYPISGESLYN